MPSSRQRAAEADERLDRLRHPARSASARRRSSSFLTAQPSVARRGVAVDRGRAEQRERLRPSRSPRRRPGRLTRSAARSRATASATERASSSETPGARSRMISTSRSRSGKSIQW